MNEEDTEAYWLNEKLKISQKSLELFKQASIRCLPSYLVYSLFCEHRFLLEQEGTAKKRGTHDSARAD